MKRIIQIISLLSLITFYVKSDAQKVAVIADAHIHNVIPTSSNFKFPEFYDSDTESYYFIKSLKSQLNSTRLFNENYFAFIEALNQIAKKDIKFVILNGDYSDDGQKLNIDKISEILNDYYEKYQMRFFIINGNHEATNLITSQSRNSEFITASGKEITINSKEQNSENEIHIEDMHILSADSLFTTLNKFGFKPHKSDIFYTTPFHVFDYENYVFNETDFSLNKRTYKIENIEFPDFTYLVEPTKDLWLLAIDGNMYAQRNDSYKNISDGYAYMQERMYLFDWLQKIVIEAKKRNKTLIAFSHYPILDFNNNLSEKLEETLGKSKFQLKRVPEKNIQDLFLETGIPLHFGGHMHINQNGYISNGEKTIWNIQTPSLAAFPPAYKTIEANENEYIIETIPIKNVENLEFFKKIYQKDQSNLEIVNHLNFDNYYQFTKSHLKYLSENRFLNSDFEDEKWKAYKEKTLIHFVSKDLNLSKNAKKILQEMQFKDLINDLYLIRNGNDLGINEIKKEHLKLFDEMHIKMNQKKTNSNQLEKLFEIVYLLKEKSLQTKKIIIKK